MGKNRILTIDCETNGLLDQLDTIHCAIAKDYNTGEIFEYRPDEIEDFCELIENQIIIAHNGINFDIPALQMFYDVTPKMMIDTLVMSRVLNPDRERPAGLPQRVGPHSLAAWGHRLDFAKGDYGQQSGAWDEFNEDMLDYCVQDTLLCELVYKALLKEMEE